MTPPIRPETDPLEALKALKQQANPDLNDPLAQLKALRPPKHDYHAEYKSGKLQERMANANARDAANLADEQGSEPVGPLAAFGHSLAATGANIAQGIPGMEAVEAGARSLVRGQPYREALGDIRSQTGKIPNKLAIPERIAGALPLSRFLPASPVTGGAILGAAEGALSADPDLSLSDRATRAAAGAATGGILGKAGETLVSGGRALLAKGAARNLVERNAARAASAKQMYGQALAEGQGKEATDAIKDFLHETGIEEIVDELKQTRPFQTVAHDGPEMLDAVYKVLSDRAASLKKGLDAVSPNRPNIGRFRLQDTKAAQSKLLKALEAPGTKDVEVEPARPAVTLPAIPRRVIPGAPAQEVPAIQTAQSPAPDLRDAINNFWTRQGVAAQRGEGTVEQQIARQALERHGAMAEAGPISGAPGPRTIPATPEQVVFEGMPERVIAPARPAVTKQVATPPVMPGYRNAVEDYAQRSGDIEGVQRGYEALRLGVRKNLPTAKNLLRKSPEALQEWAKTAPESQRRAAAEGALGAVRAEAFNKPIKSVLGLRPAMHVGPVLRNAADPHQALADQLLKILLLSGGAARQ